MRVFIVLITALLALHTSAGAQATAGTPTAVLVQVSGDVQVQRGSTALRGAVGSALMVGDRIQIGPHSRATLLHSTGAVEVMQVSALVAARSSRSSPVFEQTLATLAQIATTDARSQPNRQGMIRPAPGTAVPVSPRNGIKILDPTPQFIWLSIPDANSYTLQVKPADGEPIRFQTDSDTAWTLPEHRALRPGVSYQWTAGRTLDGRTAPIQSFRMATHEERSRLQSVFDEIRSWGLAPETDGLFLAAMAYRNGGFFYDANDALNRLDAADEGHGRAFHLLRAEVFDALGRLDDAARHLELADAAPGA